MRSSGKSVFYAPQLLRVRRICDGVSVAPLVLTSFVSVLAMIMIVLAPAAQAAPATPARRAAPQAPVSAAVAPTKPTPARQPALRAPAARNPKPPNPPVFVLSNAAFTFLRTRLHLPITSRQLTGTLTGSVLTVLLGSPTASPIALPGGLAVPAFGQTTITVTRPTGLLTLTTAASSASGLTGVLAVSLAHADTGSASGSDLTVTLRLHRLPVFGVLLDLTGRFSRSAAGALSGSMTTLLTSDAVAQPDAFTLSKGSRLTLSTSAGLTVAGNALLGPSATAIPVAVSGSVSSVSSWHLQATTKPGATVLAPLPGLRIAPNLSGTISDTKGVIRFTVTATEPISYAPTPALLLAATSVVLSNTTKGLPVSCPSTITDGHLWILLTGTATASPGGFGPLTVAGTACADVTKRSLEVSGKQTTPITLTTKPATVQLRGLTFQATADLTAKTFTGSGSGVAAIVTGNHTVTAKATFSLFPDGTAVVGFIADLSALGVGAPGSSGQVYWASKAVPGYVDPVTGQQINLASGINGSVSFTLSSGVYQFLTGVMHLPLGASPTLTGTLAGSVLTVSVGAPTGLPITLPAGLPALTFAPTTLVIDKGTGILTVDSAATAADGITTSLHLEVDHAATSTGSGSDIHLTLAINGVPIFGTTVDLTGSLTRIGGVLGGTLTAILPNDTVVRDGVLTIAAGSSLSLDVANGLTLSGTALLGPSATALSVAVDGTFSGIHDWSLTVSTAATAPTYQPLPSLSLTPAVTGTISDAGGVVTFDVSADGVASWTPGTGATVAVTHVEVSNDTPAAGLHCPDTLADGQVWLDVSGTVAYGSLSLAGEACVDPQAESFVIGTVATGALLDTSSFTLDQAALQISGDVKTKTFAAGASAQLTLTQLNLSPITVGVSFLSGGGLVAGVQLTDLSTLGIAQSGGGSLFVSSKSIKNFDPTVIPGLTGSPFNLKTGVDVTFADALPDFVITNLAKLNITLPSAQVLAVASLGSAGFTFSLELTFGAGKAGVQVYDANSFGLWINSVSVGFTVSATSQTVSLAGTALLELPPASPGGSISDVSVTLNTSFTADTVNLSLGLVLAGICPDGVTSCPWTDAFGIRACPCRTLDCSSA